jgi:hypothetical protein
MRLLGVAIAEPGPVLDRRAKRQRLVRWVLIGFAVLCLTIFCIIGAIVANSATSSEPAPTPSIAIRRADWHGVPQHPDAVPLRALGDDADQFVIADTPAAIGEWYEQAWTAFGLHYVETTSRDGMAIRWFETATGIASDRTAGFRADGNIFGYRRFGYAVTSTGPGGCTIILMRTN